jgi:hypothetical protein
VDGIVCAVVIVNRGRESIKIKSKVTVGQAMKAQRGNKGIVILFLSLRR